MVAALTLARKEGLDPGLREAFARSGTAHLLAISGFHVGVVSSLLLVLLRGAGFPRRRAGTLASGGTWLYVALLGFPDAASRAALILSTLVASRARGRPPARWGGLASALLILLVLDPRRIASPGFQLSFAGAAGLVAWAPALRACLRRPAGWRLPNAVSSVLASGVAATVATLPVVAWHFERVSLVGIPATIVVSPLVAFALPGALVSLLADALHPALGRFLAGGVEVALVALEEGTRWMALPGWTSVWVSRSWIFVVALAGALGVRLTQRRLIRNRVRRVVGVAFGFTALVLWPVAATVQGRGGVELIAIDVGQGDALALRSPAGRWILVDAGPAVRGDGGGHPVVKALRDRGVVRLEALIVTHPDLDHIGGVPAVIRAVEVAAVLEPALPTGKDGYVEALEAARTRGVPWLRAEAGRRFDVDGMIVEVLHPPASPRDPLSLQAEQLDANSTSVVVAVRFGAFDALLTGDAPAQVEREVAGAIGGGFEVLKVAQVEREVAGAIGGGFEVLKVAHHGSDTSTDSVLLARTRPRVGLVSVGRGNHYGHPSPDVLGRLRRAGAEVRRTDREGTLRVLARRDGTFRIEAARSPRR
jgi:competence protein ComEC